MMSTPPLRLPLLLSLVLAGACGGDDDAGDGRADASTDASTDAGTNGEPDAAPDAQVFPDAAPAGTVCQMKDPVTQVGHFCNFVWSQCTGGAEYAIDCRTENVAGNVFSLCDCIEDGVETIEFLSSDVCSQSDWASVETIVNENCEWDLR